MDETQALLEKFMDESSELTDQDKIVFLRAATIVATSMLEEAWDELMADGHKLTAEDEMRMGVIGLALRRTDFGPEPIVVTPDPLVVNS